MENQSAAIKPEHIIEIIIRRRWLIAIPLCISLTLGFFYTIRAPQTFETSTTILIQPQRVPEDYVQSIVTEDTGQRINTISQQILSRTNLEKIIQEFDLYEHAGEMFQEDKIANLRRRIKITQNTSRRQGTEAFTISFNWSNPKTVMDVVNKLASLFMDENLKARETQARGTSEFLESELEKIQKKLEEREEALAGYRAKHMGGLPDELETNLRTLDRLQVQHTDALNALRDAQNAAALLKNQISTLREVASRSTAAAQADGIIIAASNLTLAEQQYEAEKRELDELLLKYTGKHPEVIKLTKSVEKLKQKVEEEKKVTTPEGQAENGEPIAADSSVLSQHQFSLRQIESEISAIKKNILQIKKEMVVYQSRVEDTPKREQELQSIQRDYNNIRQSYNSLLARRLEAELAVNMERKQKGEQFRIIDYASMPQKPITPNIRKLFVFTMAVGLSFSFGIIFLLEFVKSPIQSEDQIETQMGLPVLASIPVIPRHHDKLKKIIELSSFSIVSVYAGVFLMLFGLIYLKGISNGLDLLQTYFKL